MHGIPQSASIRHIAVRALALFALASCGGETPPLDDPPANGTGRAVPSDTTSRQTPVRTGEAQYTLAEARGASGSELVIRATYTNASADTAFIAPCGTSVPRFVLEKREGEDWERAWVQLCTMIGAPALAVAPGASRTDTLRITGATAPNAAPRFEVEEIPGTYRLVYEIYTAREGDFGVRDPLPTAARISNEFEIVR